jgi:hypothetical protein
VPRRRHSQGWPLAGHYHRHQHVQRVDQISRSVATWP